MGFQLWMSKKTGIRRKGTTFKELQSIFIDSITTKLIYEPIYCCRLNDSAVEVQQTLSERDFDIIGVIDANENVIGFAKKEELRHGNILESFHEIKLKHIIADSTSISELLNILSKNSYSFILQENQIVGIVTRADINKPIVRIYLFGIISLFELHLTFWINEYYQEMTWKNQINEARLSLAEDTLKKRKGNNDELTLLECLQLCDKRDILNKTSIFMTQFKFSKTQFDKLLKDTERIRNELAHSQNSIIANLEWSRFVSTISNIESFLKISEEMVEGQNTKVHN